MPEIRGMWPQEPVSTAPDVVATEWTCPTCRWSYGPIKTTHPGVSVTGWCRCGTQVEIIPPPAQSDGTGCADV